MTTEEISHRLEIGDLLVRYCHAIDQRDWPALESLFLEDAAVDYSAFGGPQAPANALPQYLQRVLKDIRSTQHTISTSWVELSGSHATARTAAQVMMVSQDSLGGDRVLFVGLWYRDTLQKTPSGWKIASRVQEYGWVHNPAATTVNGDA